jgi:beta-glucosidase
MGVDDYNTFPYPAGGDKKYKVPTLYFCDGPRGCVSGHSTCFPCSMARGATFNTKLEEKVGEAIAKEIRANGGNFFGGVCINLPYNPGMGRSQETFGEDTYHVGEMGVALTKGIQKHNVIACVKHFAFNNMERSRFKVSVTASKRTEREVFLPHFKKVIEAGAAAVMSAYNKYDGVYCGQNKYLLRDVLKGEWNFDGFVMSDFVWGTRSTKGAIAGGQDIEMHVRQFFTLDKIKEELKKGNINLEQINEAAIRIIRTLLAFANEKDPQRYGKKLISSEEHIKLAKKVSDESITLIQNKDKILPLNSKKIKYLTVVGDLAMEENIGDHGSSEVRPTYIKLLKQEIAKAYPEITLVMYYDSDEYKNNLNFLKASDDVIVVAGMKHSDEGEYIEFGGQAIGGDRKDLGLHKNDIEMIDLISKANKNLIVVLTGGNVIRANEWKNKAKGILFSYYSGMEGGKSLSDIIFGEVNPTGKLPFAIAKKDTDYPQVSWNTEHQKYGYYHGQRKLDKEKKKADFPLGFGLSYTEFLLKNIKFEESNGRTAYFSLSVKNIGKREGAEVVQLYIGFKNSRVDRPVKTLKAFSKVFLKKGETKNILLKVDKKDLAYYDEKAENFIIEDITYIAYIGVDSDNANKNKMEFNF